MSIRPATLADAEGIARVHVNSWQAAYRGILPDDFLDGLSVPQRASRWERILADPGNVVLVYEHGNQIIGFVSGTTSRDEDADRKRVAEIAAIYFSPDEWRQGYGSQLIDAAMTTLRGRGFHQVTLWVLSENQRAIEFYQKVGFRGEGAARTEVDLNGVEFHEIRLRQSLLTE